MEKFIREIHIYINSEVHHMPLGDLFDRNLRANKAVWYRTNLHKTIVKRQRKSIKQNNHKSKLYMFSLHQVCLPHPCCWTTACLAGLEVLSLIQDGAAAAGAVGSTLVSSALRRTLPEGPLAPDSHRGNITIETKVRRDSVNDGCAFYTSTKTWMYTIL